MTKEDCFRLFQQIVVKRDVFCRRPGCTNLASAGHHIFGRTNLSTAFDPTYGVGLCVQCHVPWAHLKRNEFVEWVISWMGEENYNLGLLKSHQVLKNVCFDDIGKSLSVFLYPY